MTPILITAGILLIGIVMFMPGPAPIMHGELWLAGRVCAVTDHGQVWDFQGIFVSEKEAVAACRDPSYFVMPVPLGVSLQHESIANPRSYFPLPIA